VAVLAESHISVHTWPERNFAAFDVFMCGESEPARAIPVLEAAFTPSKVEVEEILRGKVSIDDDDYLR
jgi:S-adenosylmethionine decarboxylase